MKPLGSMLRQLSFKTKLIAAFVFVIIVTITILSLINHYKWKKDYFEQVREEGTTLTQTIAQGSADPILRNDFQTLEELITNLLKKENIVYVVITDRYHHILAQSESAKSIPQELVARGQENTSPVLVQPYRNARLHMDINDISVPIIIASEKWGTVRVGFSLKHLEEEIYRNINVAVIAGLTSICLGIIVALVLMRFITRPMGSFITSMKNISAGDLHHEVNMDTSAEFKIMADSFNQMAKSLRESKEELGRTYEELAQKHKLAALGEFAARVAHEIKNPLGIIKGSAQILLDRDAPRDVREEVTNYIVEEIDRLNMRIMAILDYTRPRMMNTESVDINEALEKAIQFWETLHSKDRQITIIREFSRDLPVIPAAPELMRQVFLNLLVNADQAMNGSGELHISTRREADHRISICFKDVGKGIPEENLEKIFEPFFTTKQEGTGLGLSIVRQIVENHLGKILVRSRVGAGTEMEIQLPIS
jgi:signal transduction histidine kinase